MCENCLKAVASSTKAFPSPILCECEKKIKAKMVKMVFLSPSGSPTTTRTDCFYSTPFNGPDISLTDSLPIPFEIKRPNNDLIRHFEDFNEFTCKRTAHGPAEVPRCKRPRNDQILVKEHCARDIRESGESNARAAPQTILPSPAIIKGSIVQDCQSSRNTALKPNENSGIKRKDYNPFRTKKSRRSIDGLRYGTEALTHFLNQEVTQLFIGLRQEQMAMDF